MADSLIFSTEKQLKEFGEKIPAEKKEAIEKALEGLKEAHKNRNLTAIDDAMKVMNTAWEAASEDIYKATQNAGANPTADGAPTAEGEGQPKGEGSVQDVEYEEVKDEKK